MNWLSIFNKLGSMLRKIIQRLFLKLYFSEIIHFKSLFVWHKNGKHFLKTVLNFGNLQKLMIFFKNWWCSKASVASAANSVTLKCYNSRHSIVGFQCLRCLPKIIPEFETIFFPNSWYPKNPMLFLWWKTMLVFLQKKFVKAFLIFWYFTLSKCN